ncbi:MAG: hypothetical protein C0594_04785 [Marinilabiliales bacterium]|nr:MAG: hypothetical protein C0594_04785 [Marinilabiliales bacterium]
MNILFDIGHPAHVHLFKNFISFLKERKHNVYVVSRKKDVTEVLLDYYEIDYFSLSEPRKNKLGMLKELRSRNKQIFKLHQKYKFDVSFGTSVSIGFLNRKYGVPAYNLNEDDDSVVKYYTYLSYPRATKIINPDCIRYQKWKKKRVLYPSYHEFAYLHPNNFHPDLAIVKEYGLEPYKYIIIRMSGLIAHHDSGMQGLGEELLAKIKNLVEQKQGYRIIESHELKKQYQIKPWDLHNVLAFSRMIISDSQTMTIEGAVLGVPSIRINTFIDKSTVIEELEKKYLLAYGFYPTETEPIIATVQKLLNNENLTSIWTEKKKNLLVDKIDMNKWMIDYFVDEIEK